MDLLDPKQDVVFKLLFGSEHNERLLVSLITAVLRPSAPIVSITVLDREVHQENVDDRQLFLDVLVLLADGTKVNLEMQCDRRGALPKRWLFNWSRLYCEGIRRGDDFTALTPVVCIIFVNARIGHRFHEVFEVLETHDHHRFSDAFAIHVIDLPRLEDPTGPEGAALRRWARFLRARTLEELDLLASEDPVMADAKRALEELSADPIARKLAQDRARAEVYGRLMDEHAREEGWNAARRKSLHEMIAMLAEAWRLEISAARQAEIDRADLATLEAIVAHLRTKHAWP